MAPTRAPSSPRTRPSSTMPRRLLSAAPVPGPEQLVDEIGVVELDPEAQLAVALVDVADAGVEAAAAVGPLERDVEQRADPGRRLVGHQLDLQAAEREVDQG